MFDFFTASQHSEFSEADTAKPEHTNELKK